MNISENSSVSLLDFAFQAAGGDEIVSDKEIKALANNNQLIDLVKKLDINTDLNEKYIKVEEENANLYLKSVTNNEIDFSLESFLSSGERITAISLQPVALAFAIYVASSDGLDERENNLIQSQKKEWDCEEEDIKYYLDKFKE